MMSQHHKMGGPASSRMLDQEYSPSMEVMPCKE
jgi:hypothetical protein